MPYVGSTLCFFQAVCGGHQVCQDRLCYHCEHLQKLQMQAAFPPDYYTSDVNRVFLGWVGKTQQPKHTHPKKGSGKMNFIADILQSGGCCFGLSQWGGCTALLGPRDPELYRKSRLLCTPSRPSPALLLLGGQAFATQGMRSDSGWDPAHKYLQASTGSCWMVFDKPSSPACANTYKGFHTSGREEAAKMMPHLFYLVSVVTLQRWDVTPSKQLKKVILNAWWGSYAAAQLHSEVCSCCRFPVIAFSCRR